MENYYLTQEWKEDIPKSLTKIGSVVSDFQQVLKTNYTVKGKEEFYRLFVKQIKAEVWWLECHLNSIIGEGGAE